MRNSSPKLTRIALAIAGLFCCSVNPLMAQTVIIGDTAVEVVNVPPAILGTIDTLVLGNTATGDGTLNLYDGGILTIGSSATGQLIIGNEGNGTIVMQGGTLDVLNSDINVNAFIIGNQATGSGLFQQSGGTVTSARQLQLGNDAGSQGDYLLSGDGVLNAPLITVGFNGFGFFVQTGPDTTVNGSGGLFIGATGSLASPGGYYELNEGQLAVGGLGTILGTAGGGYFTHTAGTHTTTTLVIGNSAGAEGGYSFQSGTLSVAGALIVGNEGGGGFTHDGGDATADQVFVGMRDGGVGNYEMNGGTLTATRDLVIGADESLYTAAGNGSFVHNGGVVVTGALHLNGGYNTGNTVGSYILKAGANIDSGGFGSMSNASLFQQDGGQHTNTGLFIVGNSGGSDYDSVYLMGGGQADFNDLWVGGFGRGILNQSDGQVTVSGALHVGDGPNIDPTRRFGEYNLSGGNLTAMGNVIIGAGNGVDADPGFPGEPGGLGTFNQSGGTHLVDGELKIGQSGNVAGGTGLYTLSSGVLTVSGNTFIGGSGLPDGLVDGVGTFTQTGGTHTTIGDMNVGGGLGTYNLSGTGILNTGITYLNSDNGTSFNQSGGTHNTGNLNVYGGDYNLSGGTVNVAGNMGVLGRYGGSARFSQDGGDVFVNDPTFGLYVGGFIGAGNTGTYTLNTGTLTVVATTHVGSDAVGTFNQTGGTHTTSRLVLGENIGGNGTYNLSGGTLNDSAIIGDAGIGVMNTSGGTHNVTGDLILGNQASGNGTYNLSSTGQVTVSGSTTVGGQGTGALTISDSGSFTGTGFVRLGSAPGSQGQLVLSDSGSLSIHYTGTGAQLLVGDEGTGSVLQNGTSSVTTGSLRVGVQGGSTGTYTMDGGTLTVQDGSGVAGGMRIGLGGTGTFTQNAGTHDTTYIEIGGTNFAQGGGGTGVYNLNGGTLVSSGAISTNPQGGSSGTLNVAGGTLTAPVIINKDTLNYSGGSITASINNSANVNVSGGAARTLTGDLSNNTGGTVTVAAATPLTITGVLTQAAGASIKSDSDITVGKDYNNLGAGNGNSFDRHAGVTNVAGATFTSQIIGNNAAQTITGNVASGGTDTFTLDLGNVRGGSGPVTKNYQIANNGTGADIRGAIQTAGANGGNITDGRLSGTGVTAGNFGPIVAGANSGDLAVTLSGAGAALTGQKVAIVSNFDNVSTQIINITGGAVSALAVGNATPNSPSPVALDNFRVGTAGADTSFNVQNQTSGAGAEQLGINSAVASSGFSANNAFGAGLIGPGASATGAVTAKASGSGTAGVNTGTVTINYATDGTNIDAAFTRQAANQQVINVQATGYNAAVGSAAGSGLPTDPINLGNFHVGQVGGAAPQSQSIAITNTVAGPFTESLGVGTASVDNAAFNLSNNIGSGLVAAGTTSNGALSVARAGGTAGVNTGTIAIQYTTDGTGTSGLSAINSNAQNITVNASGYNLAQSNVIAPINIVGHTGDGGGSISQALSITNVSLGDNAYQEGLDSSFGGFTAGIGNTINPTLTGSITNLAAGATDNTSMTVAISTLTAGVFNGTVTVDQASNGLTTSGLGITNLTSQQVAATGGVTVGVFNYAEPTVNNAQPINFGNVRQDGSVANQAISVTNTAPVSAFTEALNGSVVSSPTGFTAVGSFTGLQATSPATANTSISVGMSTAAAGLQSGNVVLGFVSDGAGIAGDGTTTPLSNQNVEVTGNVFRLATGSASPDPLNLGNFRLSSATATGSLDIKNTAANDGSSEQLGIQSVGASAGFTASSNLGATRINAQATSTGAVGVGLGSGLVAGINTGTVTIQYLSDGTVSGTGAPIDSNSQNVSVNATGYNMAVGSATPTPVVLNARVGDTATQTLTVANTAAAGSYSEALNANFSGATGTASHNGGSVIDLVAGGSNTSAMSVSLDTGTAGAQNGTVTLAYQTDGAGPNGNSGLAAVATAAGSQTINVMGNVYTAAIGQVAPTVDFGIVHVGDLVAAQGVSVQNSAPVTALNDTLKASIGAATGPFTTNNGNVAGLTAGGAANTTALTVGLNTSTAGIFTGGTAGSASVALASNNPDMSDLTLPSQDVTLTATVNNYANALFGKVSGDGTLSNNGSGQFILNFGSVMQGSAALQAFLDVENAIFGPADLLNGSLTLQDMLNDIDSTLLQSAFTDVGAGGSSGTALKFVFNSTTLGDFQDEVSLSWFGHNASGYQGDEKLYTLLVRGTVTENNGTVPEPGTLLLLVLSLAGLVLQRRRAMLH